MGYLPIVKEEMPEILEEAEGVAKGSGHSLGEIMAVNCRYEVSKMPKPEECTSKSKTCPFFPTRTTLLEIQRFKFFTRSAASSKLLLAKTGKGKRCTAYGAVIRKAWRD